MTVNWYSDESEDGYGDGYELFDELNEDHDLDEEALDEGRLRIDFVFDDRNQLAFVNTVGLWEMGIPELFLQPPDGIELGAVEVNARLAMFLGGALVHLACELLDCEDFDIPPYRGDVDGRVVRFWLGDQEPPLEPLALVLDPDVDTVIRVKTSFWEPVP